jgi:small-conductance mechanosensitive channel
LGVVPTPLASRRMRRGWRLAWLASALVVSAPPLARAEAPVADAPPVARPEPKPPETIAIPEIATRAEQNANLRRTIEAELAKDTLVDTIASQIAALVEDDRDLTAETTDRLELGPRRLVVDALNEAWRRNYSKISAQSATLTKSANVLEADIQELAKQRELWQRTAEAARAAKAPDTVIERAQETVAAIAATQKTVERRRDTVLELQDRVVRELSVAENALDRIARYRKEVIGQLWTPDSRPIWRAVRNEAAAEAALSELADDLGSAEKRLGGYVRQHPSPFVAQLALFAALAWLFRRARARTLQSVEDQPDLAHAATVFQVPYSAALVLTLVATGWLHPEAPFAIGQLAALLGLFPVLRIVRPMVDPALLRGVQAFGAFYAVDRVRDLTSTAPLVEQILFLLEMLAGIALMAWLLRPRRLAGVELSEEQRAGLRPLGIASRVLFASFVFALVSGATGYMQLARLVGGGALTSIYIALALFASLRAADGLLTFALRAWPLRQLRLVGSHRDVLHRQLNRLLQISAVLAWAAVSLNALGLLEVTLDAGRAALQASLSFGPLSVSLGHIVAFGATVLAAFLLSRVLRFVLEEDVYPRVSLGRGVPFAISSLLHYVILLGGFFLAISALGIDLTRVTILAGAFGVGIGFGLQNVVNNFVSGLIMLFERPMKLGDTVQIADVSGTVERIGMRSSTLRTYEGADVVVPNASLISERLTNWTLSNTRRRFDIRVGVAYGTDPQKMLELLLSAARGHREVLAFPAPVALFMGFGDSSLDFELRAWTDAFDQWTLVRSQLALEVHRMLRDAGIEVPFPQRVLHVKSEPGRS